MTIPYPEFGDSIWVKLQSGEEFPAKWISESPAAIKVHTRNLVLIPWSNIERISINDPKAESDPVLLQMKQEIWDFEVKIQAAKKKESSDKQEVNK